MTVIEKKICLVGVYGTGKTSLVERFVHSRFSEKYHTTIGVKIDKMELSVGRTTVKLLLWDIAGRSEEDEVPESYLRGASGVLFVADGTRRTTYDQIFELKDLVARTVGHVPSAVALNKRDLRTDWALERKDVNALGTASCQTFLTSAKTGSGVQRAFQWLASETVRMLAPPVDAFGLTHQGMLRPDNQDQFLVATLHRSLRLGSTSIPEPGQLEEHWRSEAHLFVVADGVGGEAGGRLASDSAVRAFVDDFSRGAWALDNSTPELEHNLIDGIERAALVAHETIQRRYGQAERGPATTLTAAVLIWPRAYLVHIGDSRAYFQRRAQLRQITRDQTLAEELVDRGVLTTEQALRRGFDNVLTAAVGAGEFKPAIKLLDLAPEDVLLLCSDGLTKHVPDEAIGQMLGEHQDADSTCQTLVQAALDDGGSDNVTVVVARMGRAG